ncbi:MAG TPA: hypothetical protein VFH47_00335 [Candidatus Thermoplasmatota archaeon]|nr:hypothetical protein [Candidatus Thermoplasmatota archaeon]
MTSLRLPALLLLLALAAPAAAAEGEPAADGQQGPAGDGSCGSCATTGEESEGGQGENQTTSEPAKEEKPRQGAEEPQGEPAPTLAITLTPSGVHFRAADTEAQGSVSTPDAPSNRACRLVTVDQRNPSVFGAVMVNPSCLTMILEGR